jgi:hypothetical protein
MQDLRPLIPQIQRHLASILRGQVITIGREAES